MFNYNFSRGSDMIKKFEVENFRGFKDKITLDLSSTRDYKFNTELIKNNIVNKALLYGKNSAGKSNIGFAIFDIIILASDKNADSRIYINYLNGEKFNLPAKFYYEFSFGDDIYIYEYEKYDAVSLKSEKLKVNNRILFEINYSEDYYNLDALSKHAEIDLTTFANRKLESYNNKNVSHVSIIRYLFGRIIDDKSPVNILTNFINNMLWFRTTNQGHNYQGLLVQSRDLNSYIIENNLVKNFESFLKQFGINFELATIFIGNRPILGVRYNDNLIPFNQVASSGTHSLWLFFVWKQVFKTVSFLFIDEFDAFYNSEISINIVKLINEMDNFQSILTTHSEFLLSNNSLTRPDCSLLLEDLIISPLSSRTNRELRLSHNIEKLYRNKEFSNK